MVKRSNSPGRSPYGERGLKSKAYRVPSPPAESLSLRRAWIEIDSAGHAEEGRMSLSLRRAWIEIVSDITKMFTSLSLSLRRAWIEIGVIRRMGRTIRSLSLRRAWIEIRTHEHITNIDQSLSLRRAWIEIVPVFLPVKIRSKSRSPYGERGLKFYAQWVYRRRAWSLSLRRAWIEIISPTTMRQGRTVALLTESVD